MVIPLDYPCILPVDPPPIRHLRQVGLGFSRQPIRHARNSRFFTPCSSESAVTYRKFRRRSTRCSLVNRQSRLSAPVRSIDGARQSMAGNVADKSLSTSPKDSAASPTSTFGNAPLSPDLEILPSVDRIGIQSESRTDDGTQAGLHRLDVGPAPDGGVRAWTCIAGAFCTMFCILGFSESTASCSAAQTCLDEIAS
jgi:hypothetical protein